MSKLRTLVLATLFAVLSLIGTSAHATPAPPVAAVAHAHAQTAEETAQQDQKTAKSKLVAGGVALVLLLLVVWGRSLRKPKKKKEEPKK
ncbi:hypothetical protein SAMN05421504_108101 [Amycolatopsis xylanica]|uniref:MYXO-CTERM domain-containing protein n=1 Tax=Amycolatopsis xylanica TaxID=589385 RepID=A0A1H3PC32_9PSEU|nr:hypothetical protein [Amycolatopsis xylanica]SDY97949.1 hypothetical protein SAMN05421504_108101 [Amycolatopsis xylanica]